ncbi:ankyrin repeat domain-containing protein [Halovulum dunhuangense]|uniref:Ankyrin repeat domain-containing protein n=1 Tax=Halovulum dunhuangense TaxID=1505036 RepID=A0A849L2F0_9RHOB|nr:ankyrin repeat domain-containing protein [Halovulum dunhuangense]NNU80397.1 ankyrin repeat domain-containing protein [Halovulum dunhuangense]
MSGASDAPPIPKPGEIAHFLIRTFGHVDDQNEAALKKRLQEWKNGQLVPFAELRALIEEHTRTFREHASASARANELLDEGFEIYRQLVLEHDCGNLPSEAVRREVLDPLALVIFLRLGGPLLKPLGLAPSDIISKPHAAIPTILDACRKGRSWRELAEDLGRNTPSVPQSENWERRLRDWRNGREPAMSALLALMASRHRALGAALVFVRAYKRYCSLSGIDPALHRSRFLSLEISPQTALDRLKIEDYPDLHDVPEDVAQDLIVLRNLVDVERPKQEGDAAEAKRLIERLKARLHGRPELAGLGFTFGRHALQIGDLATAANDFESACERFAFRSGPLLTRPLADLMIVASYLGDKRRLGRWQGWCEALGVKTDLRRPKLLLHRNIRHFYPEGNPVPRLEPHEYGLIQLRSWASRSPDMRHPDREVKGYGTSPKPQLSIFANCDDPEKVKALLERGADPNKLDAQGGSPLLNALLGGSDACFHLLLPVTDKATLNARTIDGHNLLSEPISQLRPDWVRALLEAGVHVDLRCWLDSTPLYQAVGKFKENWAEAIASDPVAMENSARLMPPAFRVSGSPFLPDHVAAQQARRSDRPDRHWLIAERLEQHLRGQEEVRRSIVTTLLDYGSDVNAVVGEAGFTPFLFAAEIGNPWLLWQLLEHDADVGSRLKNGMTAYHILHARGHASLATELMARVSAMDRLALRDR